jgi:hypothetical protein
MDVPIEVRKRFHTTAPIGLVFDVLSDVPRSVSHYPDVANLEDLGGGAYRWVLREMGAVGIRHQVSYGCRYVRDRAAGIVTWTPVDGVGNGRIAGRWGLTADANGTWIDFNNTGTLSLPIPRMLRSVGVSFVQSTFSAQIETYLANLMRTFETSNG